MFGVIGILACMPIAAAVVSAAVAVASTCYTIYNANDTADQMDAQNAKNEERMNVQNALAERQNKRALIKASQMAASGTLMDKIKASDLEHRTQNERRKLHRVDASPGSVPRAERDYGTAAHSSATIRI